MIKANLFYAQSGGVTAVINATATAVIEAARARADRIGKVLAGRHGILGALQEDLLDTSTLTDDALQALAQVPGGAFGSCRFDIDDEALNPAQYDRLFDVFAAHDIGYFLYNGGNGSMDTVARLSAAARRRGFPLVCIGVPKTVDNDLEGTDCSPGYGSAAKFVATSMLEAGLDLSAMAGRIGRVFVMEVMGRNAGWLAAASALAGPHADAPPHLILMPEVRVDKAVLLAEVRATVERIGYCAIAVSEGIRGADGAPLMEQGHDSKGHVQLGGAGQCIGRHIHDALGYKLHWAVPDYLQRAAGHLVSATDHAQAQAVGRAAVAYALEGRDGVMAAIRRDADEPYVWSIVPVPVVDVANRERLVPARFIRDDGLHVTDAARDYLRPLIVGERPPPYRAGLPDYPRFDLAALPRRLPAYRP
jgi:6-phosphofructokinase 1